LFEYSNKNEAPRRKRTGYQRGLYPLYPLIFTNPIPAASLIRFYVLLSEKIKDASRIRLEPLKRKNRVSGIDIRHEPD
jgi:hypothetical protein